MIETCFSTGHARKLARDLRRFTSRIHEERFGTVASCIPKLLALNKTLQWGWDLAQYERSDGRVAQPRNDDEGADRAESEGRDEL